MINFNPAVGSPEPGAIAPALAATLRDMSASEQNGNPMAGFTPPLDIAMAAPLADTLAEMQSGDGGAGEDGTGAAAPGVPPVLAAADDPSFAAFDDFINNAIGPLQDALQQAAEAGVPWQGGGNANGGQTTQNSDGSAQNAAGNANSPLTVVAHGYQDGNNYVSVTRIQIQGDDDNANNTDQSYNNPNNPEQSLTLGTAKGDKYYHVTVTWSNGEVRQVDTQDYPGGNSFDVYH